MQFYYYLLVLIALLLIGLLTRFWFLRKQNLPLELYAEAVKNENSGHFEAAIITYESALDEVKKTRFHSTLKNKIIDKIKILHTITEYNKGLLFTRQ